MKAKFTGQYLNAFFSEKKIKTESIEFDYYNNLIDVKENEVVYVYSFKGNKLVFKKGFEKLNVNKDTIQSIIDVHTLFSESTKEFMNEYNDRLLLYLYNNNKNLDTFESNLFANLKGIDTPVIHRLKVFNTDSKGNLISVIGSFIIDPSFEKSEITQYSLTGDLKPEFLELINHNLDFRNCISQYNINILIDIDNGKSIKTIANSLKIDPTELTQKLENLYTRFNLKNSSELIEFAKSKKLIPNKFSEYLIKYKLETKNKTSKRKIS